MNSAAWELLMKSYASHTLACITGKGFKQCSEMKTPFEEY